MSKLTRYVSAFKRLQSRYKPVWSFHADTGLSAEVLPDGNLVLIESSLDVENQQRAGVVIPKDAIESFSDWLVKLTKE
jgi:predicted cupin superfamily sugar epimerase